MTESIEKNVGPCEDCGTKGTRYEENETEGHYYCWAHAKAHGFCPSCGNVVEGIERESSFPPLVTGPLLHLAACLDHCWRDVELAHSCLYADMAIIQDFAAIGELAAEDNYPDLLACISLHIVGAHLWTPPT